ncbi:MAG: helix-hairpin-helix domain-containing protein [Alphaproteobacteria bacterium]|nr:helix-hairpin-helix domain-containing protein [Alphaproteobacteria bacterium]
MLKALAGLLCLCIASNALALPASSDAGKAALAPIIQKFEKKREFYTTGNATGEVIESDLVDPFFEALGWDVHNTDRSYLYARDVVPFAKRKVGVFDQYINYAFQVDGVTRFYATAIPGYVDTNHRWYVFQLKRVAWSSGVPIAVITNFRDIRVFDTRIKPDIQQPEAGELLHIQSSDYSASFQKLWTTFSKPAVVSGSLSKLLSDSRATMERESMDKAFLQDWDGYRLKLANNIYKNNPKLSEEQLNLDTNHILNQLLFARVLEDRDIEPTGRLREAMLLWDAVMSKSTLDQLHDDITMTLAPRYRVNKDFQTLADEVKYLDRAHAKDKSLYAFLKDEFIRLQKRYNGVIFKDHPSRELKIDDDVLKEIVTKLYPPASPYDFSKVNVEVLGEIHQQYLAKKLEVRNGQVTLPARPSIREASGAFYTPKWIVDYIVDRTLGEKLQGKSAKQLSELKLLDPSCGSGAFTTAMAQKLFDHAVSYYAAHTDAIEGKNTEFPDAYKLSDGRWKLSAKKKAQLVQDSVVCTDLDTQAVENTKMWLYILILDGEGAYLSAEERARPYKDKRAPEQIEEFALPDLNTNVVNANTLVGKDFSNAPAVLEKAKAFDWKKDNTKIAAIIQNGGFDVVATNPPYVSYLSMKEYFPEQAAYLKQHYESMAKGRPDLYFAFFEKGIDLMKAQGSLGYITGNSYLYTKAGERLRDLIERKNLMHEVVDFGAHPIFEEVSVSTAVTILQNQKNEKFRYFKVEGKPDAEEAMKILTSEKTIISSDELKKPSWSFSGDGQNSAVAALTKNSVKLEEIATPFSGLVTGADSVFIVDPIKIEKAKTLIHSKEKDKDYWVENALLQPVLRGRDIRRYALLNPKQMLVWPYDQEGKLLTETALKSYPLGYAYLEDNKERLLSRTGSGAWYRIQSPNDKQYYPLVKILWGWKKGKSQFTIDYSQRNFLKSSGGTGGIVIKDPAYSIEAIAGILNSEPLRLFLQNQSIDYGEGSHAYLATFMKGAPIAPLTKENKPIYAAIEKNVKAIYKAQEKSDEAAVEKLEASIDTQVEQLYGIKAIAVPAEKPIAAVAQAASPLQIATPAKEHTVININTASAAELDKALIDIGPKKAQAIVDYRNQHGPFKTLDDLRHVKGIGMKTLERNRAIITLGDQHSALESKPVFEPTGSFIHDWIERQRHSFIMPSREVYFANTQRPREEKSIIPAGMERKVLTAAIYASKQQSFVRV